MRWFSPAWWLYVLDDSRSDHDYGTWLTRCLCRAQGHPVGVWFYNVGGTEPNMCCKGCGEDLG